MPSVKSLGGNASIRLVISIPTYNRVVRLQRSLNEIERLIIKDNFENVISVFVSDNGSTDETLIFLKRAKINFAIKNINFNYASNTSNRGFDYNVKQCFLSGHEQYCWLVSDDDNLESDILKNILNYINIYSPNLIFFNFDQIPYNKKTPLILETQYSELIGSDFGFSELIKFPKLTSLVIKRKNLPLQVEILDDPAIKGCAFSHIALALQTAFHFGGVLLAKNFSAAPDANYRDHIDFPPYVGNGFNMMLAALFNKMGKPEWTQRHVGEHVDVAISSLEWLIDYFMGRAVVSDVLRAILMQDLKKEIYNKHLNLLLRPKFIRRCIYLLSAFFVYYYRLNFLNKIAIKKATQLH